eukprot:m.42562 g.42562  ORF g.42562 m.42562 type:complete len:164 (-) comp11946_c1_seq2:84-575(-)
MGGQTSRQEPAQTHIIIVGVPAFEEQYDDVVFPRHRRAVGSSRRDYYRPRQRRVVDLGYDEFDQESDCEDDEVETVLKEMRRILTRNPKGRQQIIDALQKSMREESTSARDSFSSMSKNAAMACYASNNGLSEEERNALIQGCEQLFDGYKERFLEQILRGSN